MAPPSYRLDQVAVRLIERLEGMRRTFLGRPQDAAPAFRRAAEEMLAGIIEEHDEMLGASGYGAALRREALETFLPRYVRLAVDHNALEEQGYRLWRRGDAVFRGAVFLAAITMTYALLRELHSAILLLGFVASMATPFLPEIAAAWHTRQYRRLLEEVVDDMGKIQGELDVASGRHAASTSTEESKPSAPVGRDRQAT